MIPVSRRHLGAAVLALSGAWALPAPMRARPSTRRYVGHAARLSADIPCAWTVGTNPVGAIAAYDYQGSDGFVACFPVAEPTLDAACAAVAASARFADHESTVTATTWSGQAAGRVDGQINDNRATALVVPHPYPFDLYGERMTYAALVTDPDGFAAISRTLSFEPDDVSPGAYVTSVLELVEARAYWSDAVDWDLAREVARVRTDGLLEVSLAQGAIAGIVEHLTGAGDNHSRFIPATQSANQGQTAGAGMLVGERRVLLVYADGPAARTGVRSGDLIEAVDGRPFLPALYATELAPLLPPKAELTLRRPGVDGTLTVTIEQGPYSEYVEPSGRRLPGDLGSIDIPHFVSPGRQADYVAAARSVILEVDDAPTRGWVVDLRLNTGGSYSPMIGGLAPVLGDGTFVGWNSADGQQSWVTLHDGQISDNGQLIADHRHQPGGSLRLSDPPVAVLTSPMTSSSGEVAALAFVGRPATRFFGERSGGYTTGNVGYPLFDGASLALAEVAMTDRLGFLHMEGVEPDEAIPIDWGAYGTDDDPVFQAAMGWLREQACLAAATPTA